MVPKKCREYFYDEINVCVWKPLGSCVNFISRWGGQQLEEVGIEEKNCSLQSTKRLFYLTLKNIN